MSFRYHIAFEAAVCASTPTRTDFLMRIYILSFLMALLALGGCGNVNLNPADILRPYRMEIQQGNFITQEMVSQLKLGQTREQVRFILGSPLVTDVFHTDRWDYVFARRRVNSSEVEQRRIVVFFVDGKLSRIEGDVVNAPGVAAAPATPAGGQAEPQVNTQINK